MQIFLYRTKTPNYYIKKRPDFCTFLPNYTIYMPLKAWSSSERILQIY